MKVLIGVVIDKTTSSYDLWIECDCQLHDHKCDTQVNRSHWLVLVLDALPALDSDRERTYRFFTHRCRVDSSCCLDRRV